MIKAKAFEKWMETGGLVSDPEFGAVTNLLSNLPIVDTGYNESRIFGIETAVYVTADDQYLQLVYAVRTPNTPKGVDYTYYFGKA
ncbi:hypothetical protein [Bacillus phage PK16]|nr:hypothetical protein [Bacillus phage PK16]AUM58920.1 hypothetical protein BCP01_119 [Bacillus phage BCP01]